MAAFKLMRVIKSSALQSTPLPANQLARPAEIYLRFLCLAEALRGLPSLPELDPLEERILHLVATAGLTRKRLSVRDVMAESSLASPATLHIRLTSMREKGWIALSDTDDSRRKQIDLTPAALVHFDRLSEAFLTASKEA